MTGYSCSQASNVCRTFLSWESLNESEFKHKWAGRVAKYEGFSNFQINYVTPNIVILLQIKRKTTQKA